MKTGAQSAEGRAQKLLLRFLLPSALCALLSLSGCQEASGVREDPLDREAEDALVAYLKIDTSNPPGNESKGAVYLRDLLAKNGIAARLVGADPKRQGVYARLESGTDAKALLLISHIDVVPAEGALWRNPPFGGVREGGYLWGRGALDIKSLTIAHLFAMVDLKRRGVKLERDVVFLAVPDEELGGMKGTQELLEKRPELFEGVGFAMNEGGANEVAVDRVIFWGIEVQQKVPLWLRVTCEGGGGHGAMPPEDGGATAKLVRALAAVDAIETPYRLDPGIARTIAAASAVRTDARGAKLRLIREPLDVARIERELTPGYRALLRDSIAITNINAGSAVNVMPARAVAGIDIRLLPSSSSDEMLERVRAAVGKDGRVDAVLTSAPTAESPASGELWDSMAKKMRASSPGSTAGPIVTAGTTDSRFLRARGIAAYGMNPFKVNYYDAEGVHGQDERIRARFFAEGARLTREIVRDFCSER
ncbi:MAG TPA: M20/M25/M40 family metallo-hydrolase [Thermoanaerobaculia bacterium]|nr:M20/M25/M40 family metallo-hydrolase [Thermoanaerobaculia bacterium]